MDLYYFQLGLVYYQYSRHHSLYSDRLLMLQMACNNFQLAYEAKKAWIYAHYYGRVLIEFGNMGNAYAILTESNSIKKHPYTLLLIMLLEIKNNKITSADIAIAGPPLIKGFLTIIKYIRH